MHAVDNAGTRCVDDSAVDDVNRESVLIEFTHGLGDSVQLTIVLRHLAKHRPHWDVDIATLPGKDSCFTGLCRSVFLIDSDEHKVIRDSADRKFRLEWWENYSEFANAPKTKVTNCLKEIFGIDPDLSLYRYSIEVGYEATAEADAYLSRICGGTKLASGRFPVVAIHYQANTSSNRKDLPHWGIQELCGRLLGLGYVPMILDWDRRSPLPDGRSVFCPSVDEKNLWKGYGTGDAERLAALISRCSMMIGVDSGPLHVAGSTDTPTIGVWTDHAPIQFFDLCPNVVHLLPAPWTDRAPFNQPEIEDFFRAYYKFEEYRHMDDVPDSERVFGTLGGMAERILSERGEILPPRPGFKTWVAGSLTATSYGRDYYEQHREAGLDYLNFGDWQREYGRWFVQSLGLERKTVLDVGCACGSIVRGIGEAGAFVSGCDVSEHMITLAKRHWPDMRPILHVCDAINLHLWRNETFDCIHSAQSAEHWRPDHVPLILQELLRVTKPGGVLWVSLDTQELYDRQGRDPASEDATHICIKPRDWWVEQLSAAGWVDCTEDVRPAMTDRVDSFFKKYDWDWFAGRRPE